MIDEILDIVNTSGEIIGKARRSEIHGNPSLIHRVTHVLVFNSRGEILLQKRSMKKDVAPGKWDTSVGGHVNHGESIEEAVLRELAEELGIRSVKPEFIYSYIHSNQYETELVYTHHCIYNGRIDFNMEEIEEVRFWDINVIEEGNGEFSDNLLHEIRLYKEFIKRLYPPRI